MSALELKGGGFNPRSRLQFANVIGGEQALPVKVCTINDTNQASLLNEDVCAYVCLGIFLGGLICGVSKS